MRAIAVLLLLSGAVYATPITSGTIQITGVHPVGTFDLLGDGFEAIGGISAGGWLIACTVCSPGPRSVNGGSTDGDLIGWSVATVTQQGARSFLSVTGPNIIIGATPGTYTGTFSFTGALCKPNGPICSPQLDNLVGGGTVSLDIIAGQDGNQQLWFSRATYTFLPQSDLSAVPEPATWGLMVLAGLALVSRRPVLSR